ncbi:hypothetical protein PHPALM_30514 [Phytophthora palmivora]|uniref:SWIM-type domain-containing protein n=1 Tax=Phytophthora palmivora TaxID=4796 RepID=A0A2P4X4Y7_9STRA|nr:hypothetical protein PHPALM_30514 [Phytophthora palmivora]
MIEGEMLLVHNGSTTTMTGTSIKKFLKSKGADVSASVVSRMKQAIDVKLHGDLAESYQNLEAYFTLMGDKKPGSVWVFEKSPGGNVFGRACFIPNVGIHMAHENFPCVHAICAAIHEGLRIEQLYDTRRLSNGHFRDTYSIKFLPWLITATLRQDLSVLPPHQETPPEIIGKRGLKPDPKPIHNRKESKKAVGRK